MTVTGLSAAGATAFDGTDISSTINAMKVKTLITEGEPMLSELSSSNPLTDIVVIRRLKIGREWVQNHQIAARSSMR